jgi:2-polyprenyl-3-methyl-5-hydroxy-6-metoxy-1,4-benzoquinol methylase
MPAQNGHHKQNNEAFTLHTQDETEFALWQAEKIKLIIRTLEALKPSGIIADVGCFTGYATERFCSTGFKSVVGFDMNSTTLEHVKARGIEARKWCAGDEPCPAPDGAFDVTVAADIIEHIVDTDYFLDELHRITKDSGYVIITTPNLAFWLSRIRLLLGKPPWSYPAASPTIRSDIKIDLNHIRVSNQREWRALFESHGFKVEQIKGWSILPAIGGNHLRRMVDRFMTRRATLAFGLLFLLRKN